jgi:hypothetical protein
MLLLKSILFRVHFITIIAHISGPIAREDILEGIACSKALNLLGNSLKDFRTMALMAKIDV